MRAPLLQVLLALWVLTVWLGAAAFARLAWPLDRLHCVTFVNVAGGASLLIAAALRGGSADDVLKLALLLAVLLAGGAATAHATARAILRRRASG